MTAPTIETTGFGRPTQINFSTEEFEQRQAKVRDEMARRGLDGLLVFKIEDQHWLCGLDTTGFTIFHAMFIGVNGELTHLSRSADLANIAYTSTCSDVRLWDDAHGNARSSGIKDMLSAHAMQNRRVGVQLDTFGMLPDLHLELSETLAGWCELVDASDLIRLQRLVKSEQELRYMRRAGEILTRANEVAVELVVPGAFEGDVMGEFNKVVLGADGDICAEPNWPMGSGPKALLVRHVAGRRTISENDQVIFEPGASYRHYNVANMFTVLTGPKIDPRHLEMHEACVAALDAVQAKVRPGNTLGDVFAAHRDSFTASGHGRAMLRACGYPMGAMWPPTWMEKPMIAEGEPLVLETGMTIFTHMILTDRAAGLTMCLGETVAVTEAEPEVLAPLPRTPFINGR